MKFMNLEKNDALINSTLPRSAPFALSALLCLLGGSVFAADKEIEELKRAIQALQAENRALAQRVFTLEAGPSDRVASAVALPAPTPSQPSMSSEAAGPPRVELDFSNDHLAQRIRELEIAKAANEQATRRIIGDSLAKTGSKINNAVTLGGTIEMLVESNTDFLNKTTDAIKLGTAELDLEIQVNPWTLGTFAVEYVDGTGLRRGSSAKSVTTNAVDRINLSRAYFTIGDTTRFPLYLRAGQQTLPFGTSTGVHRADVLTIDSPLTTDAFEIRKNAIGLGFGLPTPTPTRSGPPVFGPVVKPLLFAPLGESLAQGMGYRPAPARPTTLTALLLEPKLPPFYGSFYYFDNSDAASGTEGRQFRDNMIARLGYRANGHCGKPYSELGNSGPCPWTLDMNLDYNSSVFDSRFLSTQYSDFATQIGAIKGMAANIKTTLGPVSLVAEWNGATQRAVFVDGQSNNVSIMPSAWQVSMGYQFGWNPWVSTIGAQGTFAAISYSETKDLAGVMSQPTGIPATSSRVGFLPKQKLTATLGEWLMDGVKLVFEYSLSRDYSVTEGGTGNLGRGLVAMLAYAW